jgi:hypothetical protein
MAVRLLTANATLSTSAGSWKKCEAANLGCMIYVGYADDLNTTRYSAAFNATVGVNLQGVFLALGVQSIASGAVTVTLQENTGAWNDVAGTARTLNVSSLLSTGIGAGFLYITFSAPYTATANQFRVKVSCDTASRVYWLRNATAANYTWAVVGDGDDASKIQSGDTALIDKDVSLTMDESLTLAATNGVSMMVGDAASFLVPPPVAPITLATGAGKIQFSLNFTWRVGTDDANRITIVNQVTLSNTLAASGYLFELSPFYYDWAGITVNRGSFEWWGAKSDDLRLIAASDAAAGTNVVATVEDIPASWADGDVVTFAGKDRHAADAQTYYIIKGVKQITLYTAADLLTPKNLDYLLLAGAAIVNLTEGTRGLGIQISSTNQTYIAGTNGSSSIGQMAVNRLVFEGVNLSNVMLALPDRGGAGSIVPHSVQGVLCLVNGGATNGGSSFDLAPAPAYAGGTMANVHVLNAAMSYGSFNMHGLSANYAKITLRGFCSGAYAIGGAANTVSDIIWTQIYLSGVSYDIVVIGAGHTISDFRVIGGRVRWNCNGSTITRYKQQRCSDTGTYFKGSVGNLFTDCIFGAGTTNTTADIDFEAFAFCQNIFVNCAVGDRGIGAGYANIAVGSFFRFHDYDETSNDHRSWEPYGTLVSTGFGLTDTTVWNGTAFAAAAAGQFGVKIRPAHATNKLIYQDNFPNNTPIGNCQNLPVQVSCRVKISSAAYYAGVHTKPTLRVVYDGGTEVTAVASGSTDAQQLICNFTPTTAISDITITLEMATDATGTDADVYVGELMVLKPEGIVEDYTRFGSWANGLPLGTRRTFPAPQSIWDVPRASHTTSGTFGEAATKILNLAKAILGGQR